ncbi:MAG: ABC transporter permease [Treponema sp.]|nr:ABC transporter permease [Treponema sp.]
MSSINIDSIDKSDLELVPYREKIEDVAFKTESISYIRDVWKRFKRDRVTQVAGSAILVILIMAIIGPFLNDHDPLHQIPHWQFLPPRIPGIENIGIFNGTRVMNIQESSLADFGDSIIAIVSEFEIAVRGGNVRMLEVRVNMYNHIGANDTYFWFGSDALGRDVFTRLWNGARISLLMAFSVSMITLSIGFVVGSICGYYGGWVDMIIQRCMEIIGYIPQIPLFILLILRFGASIQTMIMVFVLTGWLGIANGVRIQFYRFKNREYVLASRTMGASDPRLMFKHIAPNAIGTIITQVILVIPFVVFAEAGLSYLGLGVQPPATSIGLLLVDGQNNLRDNAFLIGPPSVVIITLMLAFNLFGNGLRDAFNPSLRQ